MRHKFIVFYGNISFRMINSKNFGRILIIMIIFLGLNRFLHKDYCRKMIQNKDICIWHENDCIWNDKDSKRLYLTWYRFKTIVFDMITFQKDCFWHDNNLKQMYMTDNDSNRFYLTWKLFKTIVLKWQRFQAFVFNIKPIKTDCFWHDND